MIFEFKNMVQKSDGEWRYQTAETGEVIRVVVRYIKSASASRRGIHVSVEPWTIEPAGDRGFSTESTTLMSDASTFVEHLARIKPSAVAQVAAKIDAHAPAFAQFFRLEGQDKTKQALKAFFEAGTLPVVSTQSVSVERTKLALKRDPLVPVGQTSPLHVDCPCGRAILIITELNGCHGCGLVVDSAGWIKGNDAVRTPDGWMFI
jgi:hypothetical protein